MPLACLLEVTSVERLLLILVPLLALVVELLNSTIETTVDRISLDLHPLLSKRAKDMGSAAQLITLALIVLTWTYILLYVRFFLLFCNKANHPCLTPCLLSPPDLQPLRTSVCANTYPSCSLAPHCCWC